VTALKWSGLAWVGVLAAGAVCLELFLSNLWLPLAQLFGWALIPFLVPPFLLVMVVTPAWVSLWVGLGLFAIATYLWMFVLVALGRILMLQPWGDGRSLRRWPLAMY
jgi:hypothetical protein